MLSLRTCFSYRQRYLLRFSPKSHALQLLPQAKSFYIHLFDHISPERLLLFSGLQEENMWSWPHPLFPPSTAMYMENVCLTLFEGDFEWILGLIYQTRYKQFIISRVKIIALLRFKKNTINYCVPLFGNWILLH